MLLIQALGKQRQVDLFELEVSLGQHSETLSLIVIRFVSVCGVQARECAGMHTGHRTNGARAHNGISLLP